MPLNSGDPIGIAGPFDRLDYVVGRTADDAEIASRFANGLVMRAIDLGSEHAKSFRDA